jgi:Tfp pilus assembly protein PilO
MSEHLYLISLCLPLATFLAIFGMRYFALIQQAKARFASDEAYRVVAEKAVASQAETAAVLASIDASLADVKTRLSAVEKILKDVG